MPMTDIEKGGKTRPVKDGHLPVTELTSPMAAASSPFGDDLVFPLPPEKLHYSHAEPQPPRIDDE